MKLLKYLLTILCLLLPASTIIFIVLYFTKTPFSDLTTRLILTGVLTVNILALLTLMFFVGKNLFRLYTERRYKIAGHKFRIKLMSIFVILTLIPSAFLFIAASGLASNYINRLFSPQMKEPFTHSIDLARAFYDFERDRMLTAAKEAANWQKSETQDNITGLNIYKYTALPAEASDIIKDAFKGKESTEIISQDSGDIIRAAVPYYMAGAQKEKVIGVIVAETVLPRTISEKSERLRYLYEDYLKLESFKEPLKLNYMIVLGFFTLMIVFTALWVSLKISRGITVPIQSLALAQKRIASGDLDVSVDVKSEDEIGILTDSFNQMVKQLKENKESLEKSYIESDGRRLYLENILQNINSGVICFDTAGKVLTINKAACDILGITQKDAIIGMKYMEFISYTNSMDLVEMVKEIEGKEIRDIKKEIKANINSKILDLQVYISGIRETITSKPIGLLVVFDDLTDVIKAQKIATWQEAARRLAHEIKNPLTPIKLSAERLIKKWQQKDKDFDAVFEKSTKTIIAEADSMKKLVDVFSIYGRMPEVSKAPANIIELIESAVSLYRGFKDIEIHISAQNDIDAVAIDSEQIKRVFINIIDNAIKAMNGKGVLNISVKANESVVTVDIADTGPGISDEEKDKLFYPYFSKRKDGTGLGLAIAHKILTDHGGRILVMDNTPVGSVFTVEIPV